MDSYIEQALQAEPDFSQKFTDEIDQLRLRLTDRLGLEFRHDADMNYAVSQKLSVQVKGSYELVIYLSSRAPLFALWWLKSVGPNQWAPMQSDEQVESNLNLESDLIAVLEELGLKRVEKRALNEPVPGAVTVLDGAPATVFDVLFSELH